jgi:methyltransferase
MSLWWIFAFLLGERLAELCLATKNRRILLRRGGVEFFPESYRIIVVMHLLFLASLVLESYPWSVPVDAWTLYALTVALLLQLCRYWCVLSLKEYWNTRIILVPGAEVIRRGPYRFMRHPNYLVVTLEFVALPLLARAPFTFLVFSVANLVVLRRRIQLEEQALRQHTDYSTKFQAR